jgi:DNA-binding winged helix-turn-helix (wHTH) protein
MKVQQDEIRFPPFRFDPVNQQVWCDAQLLPLRPKSVAVLSALLAAAGRLVTRQELLRTVWPDTTVSPAALKVCIRELRHALGDKSATPRFIETLPRQGYRFIGSVVSSQHFAPAPRPQPPTPILVGREAELQQLHAWLDQALGGERQVAFITC